MVMAHDRYMTICHPVYYTAIMRGLSSLLVAGPWILSCACALLHTLLLAQGSFCADNIIPNFFLSPPQPTQAACSDTSLNEQLIFTAFNSMWVTYFHIGVSILRVPSTKGICKSLSTSGSHLFVVSLYYGTLASVYFFSSSLDSNDKDIIASIMYAVITSRLNPFLYSFRNRDIKEALELFVSRANFLK